MDDGALRRTPTGSSSTRSSDERVMAGNGTIGLEIVEELAGRRRLLVPVGRRRALTGIASALAALRPGDAGLRRAEPETGAAVAAALAAGEPARAPTTRRRSSTAPARRSCCPAMWQPARPLLDGALAVSLDETAAAVRLLAERARVVAEGAGALARRRRALRQRPGGKLVCIVSGGNIDAARLAAILRGETPGLVVAFRDSGSANQTSRTARPVAAVTIAVVDPPRTSGP